MNPYRQYRKPEPTAGWTRIDLLLALFDGALARLDKAEAALVAGDPTAALPLLVKAQLILAELAAGVRLDGGNEETGTNLLRLYEYATHELRQPRLDGVRRARGVISTVRAGFEAIRDEAAELERTGRLQSADRLQMVMATA